MSIKLVRPPLYRVWCNHKGCSGIYVSRKAWVPREARAEAEAAGWRTRPATGKGARSAPDLCPVHKLLPKPEIVG